MIFIKNLFDKKKIIQSIIEFNKKLFLENEVTNNRIILTEFSTNKSIQAGFALFLKSLQKKTGCRIFSYNNDLNLISKKKIIIVVSIKYLIIIIKYIHHSKWKNL